MATERHQDRQGELMAGWSSDLPRQLSALRRIHCPRSIGMTARVPSESVPALRPNAHLDHRPFSPRHTLWEIFHALAVRESIEAECPG